jgi:L-threonylcarbamoyladenylate synthase
MTGKALVASSANISAEPPVTRPEEISPDILLRCAGLCVSGPVPAGGLPSTIVEVSEECGAIRVRLLRHGAISLQALEAAGFPVVDASGAP